MVEDPVLRVVVFSLLPTLATALGSALVFLRVSLDERFVDSALGFGSGLMVYIAFADLLVPSLELGGSWLSLFGFLLGFVLIKSLDFFVPHARIVRETKRGNLALIALAIAIHNVPEGLAVGTTALYGSDAGLATATAIAVQDVPEGLIVSLSVLAGSGRPRAGFAVGILSALSEFASAMASLVGLIDTDVSLPLLMSLSASAMVYVVVHEVAPEVFGHEHDEYATLGFLVGLLIGLML